MWSPHYVLQLLVQPVMNKPDGTRKKITQTKEPNSFHAESTSAASSGVLGSHDLSYNFTRFSLSWGNFALDGD